MEIADVVMLWGENNLREGKRKKRKREKNKAKRKSAHTYTK